MAQEPAGRCQETPAAGRPRAAAPRRCSRRAERGSATAPHRTRSPPRRSVPVAGAPSVRPCPSVPPRAAAALPGRAAAAALPRGPRGGEAPRPTSVGEQPAPAAAAAAELADPTWAASAGPWPRLCRDAAAAAPRPGGAGPRPGSGGGGGGGRLRRVSRCLSAGGRGRAAAPAPSRLSLVPAGLPPGRVRGRRTPLGPASARPEPPPPRSPGTRRSPRGCTFWRRCGLK